MTYYHGGKKKIGKQIAQIIEDIYTLAENEGIKIKGYCEPFVGMAGVYQYIPPMLGDKLTYVAGDINNNIIQFWKALQKGWIPPKKCSEKKYYKLKKSSKNTPEKTFIGYACDFRGSYYRSFDTRKNVEHQSRNSVIISNNLNSVNFTTGSYDQFSYLRNYIIYCDPPYDKTEQYVGIKQFDSKLFWKWCKYMAKYNIVIVSEYSSPKKAVLLHSFGEEKVYLA